MPRPTSRAAFALLAGCLLASCGTGRDAAPAWGTLGGTAVGAGIGSLSGHAGTGAFIGAMVGGSTGEIARASPGGPPAPVAGRVVASSPASLRQASKREIAMRKEFDELVARYGRARGTGDRHQMTVARAVASTREDEAKNWAAEMRRVSSSLNQALSGRVGPGNRSYSDLSTDRLTADALAGAFKNHAKHFRGLARSRE